MPYTRITSTRNGIAALNYCIGNGHGHNGHETRNILVSSYGMVDDLPLGRQFQKSWGHASKRNKTQLRRIIYSASKNEFTPGDPEAAYKMLELCKEYLRRNYNGFPAALFIQADGHSNGDEPPLYHCHMLISNVHSVTSKGIPGYKCSHRFVSKKMDEIVKEYTTIDYGAKRAKDRYTQNERRMRDQNFQTVGSNTNFIVKDFLRDQIRIALAHSISTEEFIQELDKSEIDCRIGKKTITYTLRKLPENVVADTKKFSYRDKRLGPEFSPEAIQSFLSEKQNEQSAKRKSIIETSFSSISKSKGVHIMSKANNKNSYKVIQQMLHKQNSGRNNTNSSSSSSAPNTLKQKRQEIKAYDKMLTIQERSDTENSILNDQIEFIKSY